MLKALSLYILLMIAAMLFVGCSETTAPVTSDTKASAHITIAWPSRSRMIPIAANYILITLTQNTGFSISQWVARPQNGDTTQTVDFTQIPLGYTVATAAAYYSEQMPQTAMATGTTSFMVNAGGNTFSINMGSTIVTLAVSPASTPDLPIFVKMGQPVYLDVNASDGKNNILITYASLSWESFDTTVCTVTNGIVTPVAPGSTSILVTDAEAANVNTMAYVTVIP
jgi:hypothetical protein